ncbi:MAG: LysM peptidoglycan-binding domain-containing protein [Methylotenera sp.]|nr:LysM peptidoglycan-binding domain-containing protein [Oligoflexia bacterium]
MKFSARPHSLRFFTAVLIGLFGLAGAAAFPAQASISPEEEVLKLSKLLKPIPDEQWNEIAGTKVSEMYQVNQGDTLYDISKRLFGDARFWPKIWAMNNGKILNPHQITPGRTIAFMSGTGNSLPSVAIQGLGPNIPGETSGPTQGQAPDPRTSYQSDPVLSKGRSGEWKNLKRQTWENINLTLPPEVDPQGFDSRNKIRFKVNTGFELDAIATSGKIPYIGELSGSRADHPNVSAGDTVFIDSEQGLQIGETYAVTQEPQYLESEGPESEKDGVEESKKREGYSYLVLGKVKILSVKDHQYVGTVIASKYPIPRGSGLMRVPPRIQNLSPVPGPNAVEGRVLMNRSFSGYETAQNKQVIIDRGTRDGVRPGMIFRNYQAKDSITKSELKRSNSLVNADIMIIQSSDEFSSGIVLRSLSPIHEREKVTLMMDVSHLRTRAGGPVGIIDVDKGRNGQNSNELDSLDSDLDEGLRSDEERELKQLEKWEKNPDKSAPSATPSPDASAPPLTEPLPDEKAPSETPPNEASLDLALPELAPELPPAPEDTPKRAEPLEIPKNGSGTKDELDSILDSNTQPSETLPVPAPAPESVPADPSFDPPL